jgi:hypothetical protein
MKTYAPNNRDKLNSYARRYYHNTNGKEKIRAKRHENNPEMNYYNV